jgi:uroporphyrinogen decarboxylase
MAYRDAVKDFRAIRRGVLPARVPVVACSEEFDVKWYAKYDYETFCQDGAKMAETLGAAVKRFDYDWVWVQIDDCFEFEPLGIQVHGEGDILRATCGYLPIDRAVFKKIAKMDPLKDGRMPEKLKALRLLREEFGDSVLVTGSFGAPFSAVGLTWSIEESMVMMLDNPQLLQDSMNVWKEFYCRYAKAQKEAGAHAIWLGDCNAFSSMVSVDAFNEHILKITRELVQYCEKELDLMIWLHNSEIKRDHVVSHIPLGCSFESIGPAADMREIREVTKDKQAISGNLDPLEVLWHGTPQKITSEVERIMGICKPGGRYIFNTGEMNPRQIPEENMDAMVKAAKRLATY